jgi:hypothetical protein
MYTYKWLLHIFLPGIRTYTFEGKQLMIDILVQGIATACTCTFEGKQLMIDILVLLGGCSPGTVLRSPLLLSSCSNSPSDRRSTSRLGDYKGDRHSLLVLCT